MKNNIYEIINDGNFNADQYIVEELNDMEKAKMKNKFNKFKKVNNHKVHYKKAVAGFALVLAISGGFLSTSVGAQVLASFSESVESALRINKDIDDYKTVVNRVVTDKGISIQLNEVILDEDRLIISTNISSEEVLKDADSYDASELVYINGKKVRFTGSSGSGGIIDDHTFQSVLDYDLSEATGIDLSGDLDIKIVYTSVFLSSEGSHSNTNGKWKFEFRANQDMLIKGTKEIAINNEFVLPNGEKITLQKYRSNDIGQRIYAKRENDAKGTGYDIELKGTDDLGNEVEFYLSRGTEDSCIFQYNNFYRNIDEKAKQLILKPYCVTIPEQSGKMNHDFEEIGEEFVIDLTQTN